jgi:hypothetical protein
MYYQYLHEYPIQNKKLPEAVSDTRADRKNSTVRTL